MKKKIALKRRVRYFVEYIFVVIALSVFSLMTLEAASKYAGKLGRFVGRFSVFFARGRIAYSNIRRIFPNMKDGQAMNILISSYENIFRFAAEYIHQLKIDDNWIDKNITSVGLENIQNLYKERGVYDFIAITGHVGNWEPLHKFLRAKCGITMNVIYRKQNNPMIENHYVSKRGAYIKQLAKGPNLMREVISAIKANQVLAVLIDQRDRKGEYLDFFGRPSKMSTVIPRLAIKYKKPIICGFCLRSKEDPTKFVVKLSEPIYVEETGDLNVDATNLTKIIIKNLENVIKEYPEQWFWLYDMWKW